MGISTSPCVTYDTFQTERRPLSLLTAVFLRKAAKEGSIEMGRGLCSSLPRCIPTELNPSAKPLIKKSRHEAFPRSGKKASLENGTSLPL